MRPWLSLALAFALLLVSALAAPPVSATTVLSARPVPSGRAERAPTISSQFPSTSHARASTALEETLPRWES